jgi:hypothetical protein
VRRTLGRGCADHVGELGFGRGGERVRHARASGSAQPLRVAYRPSGG